MILIDEMGNLMHAIIWKNQINGFRERFCEGSSIIIKNFKFSSEAIAVQTIAIAYGDNIPIEKAMFEKRMIVANLLDSDLSLDDTGTVEATTEIIDRDVEEFENAPPNAEDISICNQTFITTNIKKRRNMIIHNDEYITRLIKIESQLDISDEEVEPPYNIHPKSKGKGQMKEKNKPNYWKAEGSKTRDSREEDQDDESMSF
ncbi:hypothetical protein H5410_030787 [Solanum commersonii]|uniref:Uncharacterized protein n=1 Tax=Solanum commersonii TaxID=4109 RepID=A0A9J5YGP7_SOLCO|nr:hypothetical protein H5410_030787 [Solanum commersonii]